MTGEVARASVRVDVPIEVAFRVFTADIDRWWRRGPRFRASGPALGVLMLEPRVGGRLLETWDGEDGPRVAQTGEVLRWEPPELLELSWRLTNFAPDEVTTVRVEFRPVEGGTFVTVTHSGWGALRPDHPARHGERGADLVRRLGLWWGDLLRSLREITAARG